MAVKVVDASAVAALLFNEPGGPLVSSRLGEDPLAAPVLLWFELASVCLKYLRKEPGRRTAILADYADLEGFGIARWDVVDHELPVLAEGLSISAYDASYVWLARFLNAELVTLDRRLARAAGAP